MNDLHVFILAAGSSSRLGQAKQLIKYKGKYLINHTIDIVWNAGLRNVSVILGANAEKILKVIINKNVIILINPDWFEGMSSSFRTAMDKKVVKYFRAALFVMCDQPLLTKELISDIVNLYSQNKNKIISCNYNSVIGPPSLFPKTYFKDLLKLKGDKGAKEIIMKHHENLLTVDFPGGELDIDSQKDLKYFLKLQ